ncbi:MAG: nucleosidase [Candidatus Nanopelagicales bacterium]
MILHRDIHPDRPLLVVALEEEAVHIHVHELPILVTGVGKVNAAIAVSTILGKHRPSSIVNLGTAGALRDGVTGTHVISSVIQHDLNDAAIFDLVGIHFGEPISVGSNSGTILATGDRFISKPEVRERLAKEAHLVDMEGYAIARAARAAGIPVTLVKEVSDQAGEQAARSWTETLDACSASLGAWVHAHLL